MVLKCCLRDGATDGKILCRVRHDEDISRYQWPRDHGGAGELDSRTVASLRALGPWAPPAERGPSLESITGFPLQLIFAKVKAENQQHLLHRYLQLSQRSTRTALYCRSVLYYIDS